MSNAAIARPNGFCPLPMSPKHYDEVEARFGLDGDLMDRLRAENVLYDGDARGE